MFSATAQINNSSEKLAPNWLARLRILALVCLFVASVAVVLGAFTRLVDAGLGCPDWPGCYGHVTWPKSDSDIAAAEAKFPEAPVEKDKTWPEMVHRYFASSLGLLIITLCFFAIKAKAVTASSPVKHAFALLILVIVQGLFGMWTVTLKLWPQVVTAHLLGGFTTLALLWLFYLRVKEISTEPPQIFSSPTQYKALKWTALLSFIFVVVQIALGGWTTSNYAAMACPDLPTCHGVWWPKADFIQGFNIFQHVGPNYLGGLLDNHARTAIHLSHRIGAVCVIGFCSALITLLWKTKTAQARQLAIFLAAVLFVQIALGLSNVYWVLPLPVAVSHNAVGALLLLTVITINYRIFSAAKTEQSYV